MKKNTQNKAFTLIELLVVISIISLLASILLPKLQQARAKADDVRRKAVLKNIQSQIIGDKADATTNFSDIFSSGSKAKDMLDTLISQTGVSSTDYDAKVSSDGTSYAVVFPLKADPTKYWCVDSTGVSKEVGKRLSQDGYSCDSINSLIQPSWTTAFVGQVTDMTMDSQGNLYAISSGNVKKIDSSGSVSSLLSGYYLIEYKDNSLYTATLSGQIYKFNLTDNDNTLLADVSGYHIIDIKFGSDGYLYMIAHLVSNANSCVLMKTSPTGVVSTVTSVPAGCLNLRIGSDNNKYISYTNGTIIKINQSGTSSTLVTNMSQYMDIDGINIYTTSGSSVYKVTPDGVSTNIGTTSGGMAFAVNSTGTVFSTSGYMGVLYKLFNGQSTSLGSTEGQLPTVLYVSDSGDVYVGHNNPSVIKRFIP